MYVQRIYDHLSVFGQKATLHKQAAPAGNSLSLTHILSQWVSINVLDCDLEDVKWTVETFTNLRLRTHAHGPGRLSPFVRSLISARERQRGREVHLSFGEDEFVAQVFFRDSIYSTFIVHLSYVPFSYVLHFFYSW